ncbi:MAG: LysR family transcriptional regulator, partial [Parasporobacterium sp.]|nr:LysR family transcriptional regulator [Parasporobacterium sp.]
MKSEHIKEFIVLAEELNYTKAAKKLYISHSSLSKHIAEAERELGVQLFVRTTHAVELTEAGRSVYRSFKS